MTQAQLEPTCQRQVAAILEQLRKEQEKRK